MNDYWTIADEIKNKIRNLDHFQTFNCSGCGENLRYHILDFYAVCPKCELETKVWIPGIKGSEIQEIIEAVLEWMGTGEKFEAVLKKHSLIQKEIEEEREFKNEEN